MVLLLKRKVTDEFGQFFQEVLQRSSFCQFHNDGKIFFYKFLHSQNVFMVQRSATIAVNKPSTTRGYNSKEFYAMKLNSLTALLVSFLFTTAQNNERRTQDNLP